MSGLDIERRHPFAVLAVMRAFGEDDDLVAHAAAVDPLTNGALIVAAAVDMGGVEAVAACRVKSVQRGKGGIEIAGIHPHRPLHEPGNRFVNARECRNRTCKELLGEGSESPFAPFAPAVTSS